MINLRLHFNSKFKQTVLKQMVEVKFVNSNKISAIEQHKLIQLVIQRVSASQPINLLFAKRLLNVANWSRE